MGESINLSGDGRRSNGGARPGAGRPSKIPSPLPTRDDPRWYVLRTGHGRTAAVDGAVRGAGFDVMTAVLCYPGTRARRNAAGSLIRRREEWFEPLFRRYVIVRLLLADRSWRRILAFDGVERIISAPGCGGMNVPIVVPDAAIERLRAILSPTGVLYPPDYRPPVDDDEPIEVGRAARIRHGAMANVTGICTWSDERRVRLLMTWLGEERPVIVPRAWVEAI
jgi:transcription antitermination factor NusG